LRRRGLGSTYSTEESKEDLVSLLRECKKFRVIVEGRKDRDALKEFGFKKITVLNEFHGFYDMVTNINDNDVLVLTDFDPEGNDLANKITNMLQRFGKKVEVGYRRRLMVLFIENKINTIEGLVRLFNHNVI